MAGGKKGLIVNSTNICKRRKPAALSIAGHNGAQLTNNKYKLKLTGCKKKKEDEEEQEVQEPEAVQETRIETPDRRLPQNRIGGRVGRRPRLCRQQQRREADHREGGGLQGDPERVGERGSPKTRTPPAIWVALATRPIRPIVSIAPPRCSAATAVYWASAPQATMIATQGTSDARARRRRPRSVP